MKLFRHLWKNLYYYLVIGILLTMCFLLYVQAGFLMEIKELLFIEQLLSIEAMKGK